ncbi:MAG: tetratricopeptide repeat protein, partial [Candidatus Schekmanbacteria bacterium]
ISFGAIGEYERGISDLTKGIEKDPENFKMYLYRAECFYKLKAYGKSIADLKEAIKNDPENYTLYEHLSECYADMGDTEKAFEVLKKDGIPHSKYLNAQANLYYHLCETDKAIEKLEEALKESPSDKDTLKMLSIIDMQIGKYNEALAIFEKLSQRSDIDLFYLFNNKGYLYFLKGDLKNALTYCKKAIEADPYIGNTYDTLGSIYDAKGDYEKAVEYFNKAIKLAPTKAIIYYNRAMTYEKMGKFNEALDSYETYLNLGEEDCSFGREEKAKDKVQKLKNKIKHMN